MHIGRTVAVLVPIAFFLASFGGRCAEAQSFQAEVGGAWAIPSSDVVMRADLGGGEGGTVSIDPGAGPQVYASIGLLWTVSENFDLEGGLRAQQSRLPGSTSDFGCGSCTYSNDPDGRLRSVAVEGQITLTSVGRINPYFLVALGVVETTVDGVLVTVPQDGQEDQELRFSEVNVTDAGGDVGFGAVTRIVGGLRLTAEIRAAGSLPGSKENAITAFPFSVGLNYAFGTE